jgi:glycosyltransferase involved in cell wall biosynthesis
MPYCSIIIRAYNEERHIGRLLDGIQQQKVPEVQIILVDSGSTDGTVSIAQRYGAEVVHIRPQEFTFGRSLNLGVAQARAEIVVIASAHVYPVYPDWLERLVEPFVDPKVALTYGKQRGTPTSKFSEHQVFRQWFPDTPRPQQGHPFCNNANAAIRKSVWTQHPYDETLPALEDLAWADWALQQGFTIQYVPEAEIVHVHHETWRGVYNRYRREAMAFKLIYPQESFHFADFVRLFLSNAWADLRVAARLGALRQVGAGILAFRWMQFWGTYQGYRRSGPLTWKLREAFYYPPDANEDAISARPITPIQYNEAADIDHSSSDDR